MYLVFQKVYWIQTKESKPYKANLGSFSHAEELKVILMISKIWYTVWKAVCLTKIIGNTNDSSSI